MVRPNLFIIYFSTCLYEKLIALSILYTERQKKVYTSYTSLNEYILLTSHGSGLKFCMACLYSDYINVVWKITQ